jgi:hypothetical protein
MPGKKIPLELTKRVNEWQKRVVNSSFERFGIDLRVEPVIEDEQRSGWKLTYLNDATPQIVMAELDAVGKTLQEKSPNVFDLTKEEALFCYCARWFDWMVHCGGSVDHPSYPKMFAQQMMFMHVYQMKGGIRS